MNGAGGAPRVGFVVPGNLATPTGGYGYDRRLIAELRALGWTVDVLQLGHGYPFPDAAARAEAGRMLAERPDGSGTRAVLIVNGLGTVKYEELFVLFRYVADLLGAAGVDVVSPLCGELVTSLDMAGMSLTLCQATDEMIRLWDAPVRTPGLRWGA